MTPFIPLLDVTSLTELFIEGTSTMTPFIPLVVVTSLTEVFIEGTEYDDTFHTYAHCDLFV
jgi:hypothetical protein